MQSKPRVQTRWGMRSGRPLGKTQQSDYVRLIVVDKAAWDGARALAHEQHYTLSQVVEYALRGYLGWLKRKKGYRSHVAFRSLAEDMKTKTGGFTTSRRR